MVHDRYVEVLALGKEEAKALITSAVQRASPQVALLSPPTHSGYAAPYSYAPTEYHGSTSGAYGTEKPCFAFQKGQCFRGESCRYSHSLSQSSPSVAGIGAPVYQAPPPRLAPSVNYVQPPQIYNQQARTYQPPPQAQTMAEYEAQLEAYNRHIAAAGYFPAQSYPS